MTEIALHILDIVQNSIVACATLIQIFLRISHIENRIFVTIKDNGKGMDEETAKKALTPFGTSRTTRKVGLGIPLFAASAEATGGSLALSSELGKGTTVSAEYVLDHIDRAPMGDFAGTMQLLIVGNPNIDFLVEVEIDGEKNSLDTREIRQALGDEVPLDTPDVSLWIKENLDEMFPKENMVI